MGRSDGCEWYFPASYEESRARFLGQLEKLSAKWPNTQLETHPLKDFPELGIDWLWAEPHDKEHLIIITTAQHGIEGFVGAAMMRLFLEDIAPGLHSEHTGLLLVHAINPWGMKHYRKVNENSVDLNRNFVIDGRFDAGFNPEYRSLQRLLTPQRPVRASFLEGFSFWARLIEVIASVGIPGTARAALLGQHHTPRGFFYGGNEHQESTLTMMDLYGKALATYKTVLHIDLHAGYGPRDQMSIIIPPADPISSEEAAGKFNYPLVQKINEEEFYAIHGDMQEYYYDLRNTQFPSREFFACGFEFGTLGGSILARIMSLQVMVIENQLHWHGASSEQAAQAVKEKFREFYFPSNERWRTKAMEDCRQAFEGVLRAHGLLV